jgi:hypothetical protein
MLPFFLICAVVTPTGEMDAMDAFFRGELYLVYIGELPPAGYRDRDTGMLLQSLGCEAEPELEQYRDDWNSFMERMCRYLCGSETRFSIRTDGESLSYSSCRLIYSDRWGSVPVAVHPEELAALAALAAGSVENADAGGFRLEMHSSLWSEPLSVVLPRGEGIVEELLSRGRLAIRVN